MISLNVYHTLETENGVSHFPKLAEGNEQWLGDGYYFWEDYEFAEWWGDRHKCKYWNRSRKYSIYKATITISEEEFIDTVFNKLNYYNFIEKVEKFAKAYTRHFKIKPTLEQFNDFIIDKGLWEDIKVVRFQDVPENQNLVLVKDYFYKKRIQIRVNDPTKITTFEHFKTLDCVN